MKIKYSWKVYYPWKIFRKYEVVKEWKDFFRVYIDLKENWEIVKASIFSWTRKQIERMFGKWCFEWFESSWLFW